jgi:hemoglobin-like flavoprotein
MVLKELKYDALCNVITSWEAARQKYGSEEEVGMKIVQNLFELDPTIKLIFGFRLDQKVTHPLVRMGVLVHAKRMTRMLDSVLSLFGPDTETLCEVLNEVAKRHVKKGVKKDHIPLLIKAVQKALREILGEKEYTQEIDQSWQDIFDDLAQEMVSQMSTGTSSQI